MLTVTIITPERSLAPIQADHVTLPAFDGEVGIRTGHQAYVCQLGVGHLKIKSSTQADTIMALKGGVAQVLKDQVKILAESVIEASAISEQELVKKLIELASKSYDDPLEFAQAKATGHWLATQLKVAGKQVPAEAMAKLGI